MTKRALGRDWPALEIATLLYEESRYRKPKVRESVDSEFQSAKLKPVSWLLKAREACAAIPIETRPRCNGAVYAVLVRPAGKSDYSVYIGSTRTTTFRGFPDRQSARIAQHFKGGRWAARRVGTRGLEPLWSLNIFFKKVLGAGYYLPVLETRVHHVLETCVEAVYGDICDRGGQRPQRS